MGQENESGRFTITEEELKDLAESREYTNMTRVSNIAQGMNETVKTTEENDR